MFPLVPRAPRRMCRAIFVQRLPQMEQFFVVQRSFLGNCLSLPLRMSWSTSEHDSWWDSWGPIWPLSPSVQGPVQAKHSLHSYARSQVPYAGSRKVSSRDRSGSLCIEHLARVAPCTVLCRVRSDLWRLSVGDRRFLAGLFALFSLQRYSFQVARRTRRGTAFVGSESSVIQRRNPSGT